MAQQETFEIHVVDDGPPASDDVNFPFTFDMVCEGEYLGSQTLDVKVPKDLAAKCEAACLAAKCDAACEKYAAARQEAKKPLTKKAE